MNELNASVGLLARDVEAPTSVGVQPAPWDCVPEFEVGKGRTGRAFLRFRIARTFGVGQTLRYMAAVALFRVLKPMQRQKAPNGQVIDVDAMGNPDYEFRTLFELYAGDEYVIPEAASQLPIRTVLDFGANIGLAALWFNMRYPDARILSFEPVFHQFRKLAANTSAMPNVEIFQEAVCAADQKLRFEAAGAGSSSVGVSNSPLSFEVEGVDIFRRLESVGAEGPFLFKLDIEGGEYSLFEDARIDAVLEKTNIAFIELHRFGSETDVLASEIHRKLQIHFPVVKVLQVQPSVNAVLLAHR